MEKQKCFLSIQGFALESMFVFKEISVLCTEGKVFQTWVLKPPHVTEQLKLFNRYVVFNSTSEFGLKWDDGFIPYNHLNLLFETISKQFQTWLVNDETTLSQVLPFKPSSVSLVVIEKRQITSVERVVPLPVTCIYNHSQCAARNVVDLSRESDIL